MIRRLKFSLFAMLFFITGISYAHAAKVDVQWDDPSSYRDIQATNSTQKKFEAKMVKELEEVFVKAAEILPADQILKVHITDVDLAGYINYFYLYNNSGVREIRNIDGPRISLSYELMNENGELIQSGAEKLSDNRFNLSYAGNLYRVRNTSFPYEKRMIENWLRDSF